MLEKANFYHLIGGREYLETYLMIFLQQMLYFKNKRQYSLFFQLSHFYHFADAHGKQLGIELGRRQQYLIPIFFSPFYLFRIKVFLILLINDFLAMALFHENGSSLDH